MAGKRLSAAERRATIIEAGRSVFLESGYEGSRTSAIAKLADVNEAVLYQHFASKYAIFEEAVIAPARQGLDSLADRAESLAEQKLSADDAVVALEQMWLATMAEIGPLLSTALLSDRANGQQTYQSIVVPVLERVDAVMATLIRDPQSRSSWTITRALFGANLLLGLQGVLQPTEGQSIDDLAEQVSGLLITGLSAP